ncbi:MAG: hypothetical protein E7612_03850 [Ruminococcaceae bacterium]|nr:hypothetical protein [Oscillospiraceae bacterium]
MNTISFNKGNTLVVAHRGLSGIEPENTNAAFIAAGNRSYYGIETDIHRTADRKFVVVHDGNLKRVAGAEIDVESSTLEELQKILHFDKDGLADRIDARVTTLENYIKICKKYEKHAVLELKSDFTDEEIEKIIEIIKSYDYLDNLTFISFVYTNLTKVRKILPNQSAQFLFSEFSEEIEKNIARDRLDVDVYYKALTKEKIDELHKAGVKVNCWTVDIKEDAEQLDEWGVDYITSNILE